MNVEDSSSDEVDYNSVNKNILKFMHFKERDQFKDQFIRPRDKNNNTERTQRIMNSHCEFDIHEEDTEVQSDDHRQYLNYAWKSKWDKILEVIVGLSDEGDIETIAIHYTDFLMAHLTHNVNVDIQCFPAMLYCIIPRVVQQIFDKGLIEAKDKVFQIYYNS